MSRRAAGKILNKEKKSLTEKEYETYQFLIDYITKNGCAPSYKEMAKGLGVNSTSIIYDRIQKLECRGKIKVKHGQPRAIKVVGYEFVCCED